MTQNLQIYLFKQQLIDIINKANLDAGIVILILKDILSQTEPAFLNQIQIDYDNYKKELQNTQPKSQNLDNLQSEIQESKNDDGVTKTFTFTLPLEGQE